MDLKKYKEVELSQRDIAIVKMLSNGMTANEISNQSNISSRTVEMAVLSLRDKYKCKNTPHLVAYFLRKQIIK
jgi:DNA-binding CsgD family transcriptional regulator